MASNVEIILTLTDKASKDLQNVGKNLKDVGGTLTKNVTLPIVAAGAAILKLSSDAASLVGVEKAFEGITSTFEGGSRAMLKALQESSGGLITNRDLMEKFNLAAGLVSNDFAKKLPDAFGFLGKVAAATGQDMGFLLDSLVRGVGRLSPLILDNLGIQVDLTAAYEAYAQQLGISASELTKTQQQTAVMNMVMEKLRANTASMPEVVGSAAAEFAGLKTMLTNVKDEIGKELLPAVIPLLQSLGELARDVLPDLIKVVNQAVKWFTSLSPTVQKAILVTVGLAAAIGPLLIVLGTLISTIGAVIPVITAVIGVISGPLLAIIAILVVTIIALSAAWENNWLGIRDITQTVIDALLNIWNFFIEQFTGIYEAFRLAFEGDWRGFGEKLREVWDNAWNAIKDIVSKAWNFIKEGVSNLIKNIIDNFKNTNWGEVGKSIVQGIANGIKSGASAIISAAKSAARAALDAAKGFLGIKSPSSVFAAIGQNMMAGMAEGIYRGATMPVLAAANASNQVSNSTVNNFTLNINEAGRVVDPASSMQMLRAFAGGI